LLRIEDLYFFLIKNKLAFGSGSFGSGSFGLCGLLSPEPLGLELGGLLLADESPALLVGGVSPPRGGRGGLRLGGPQCEQVGGVGGPSSAAAARALMVAALGA